MVKTLKNHCGGTLTHESVFHCCPTRRRLLVDRKTQCQCFRIILLERKKTKRSKYEIWLQTGWWSIGLVVYHPKTLRGPSPRSVGGGRCQSAVFPPVIPVSQMRPKIGTIPLHISVSMLPVPSHPCVMVRIRCGTLVPLHPCVQLVGKQCIHTGWVRRGYIQRDLETNSEEQ